MSLHADAMSALLLFDPPDAHQARLRTEFLGLLATRDDGVFRSCAPDHLTAGAVVLDPVQHAVLLVLHGKVRRWLQPGGHCELGDHTIAAAALREASEETGIEGLELVPGILELDRHRAPCRPGVVEHHLDVRYIMVAPPGARPLASEESLDVRWFPWDALPDDLEPSIVRMVAAARRRLTGRGAQVGPTTNDDN